MYFEETVHCPHCSKETVIEIELYQDGGDIYSDICAEMPRFVECSGCQKVFKVGLSISVDVEPDGDLTEEDVKEYQEQLEEEEEDEEE